MDKLNVLYEDEDVIVCEKPQGVPSQSDRSNDFDMVNRLKNYVYENMKIKEQPFIGLIHRLDRPVGGVMVFAKNNTALKNLNEQMSKNQIKKKYYAVIDKVMPVTAEQVTLTDYLIKNKGTNLSQVVSDNVNGSKKAILSYRVLENQKDKSLVEIELLTGRHHQIRVQMSHAGFPLCGDTKYNIKYAELVKEKKWFEVGLYSFHLEFLHPKTKKKMIMESIPKTPIFQEFSCIK